MPNPAPEYHSTSPAMQNAGCGQDTERPLAVRPAPMSDPVLPSPTAARRLPWVRIFLGLVFLALAVLVIATFRDYGISWDEEVQNNYGDKLLRFYASGFRDRSAMHYLNLFYYGGFFDLVAAIVNLVSPL